MQACYSGNPEYSGKVTCLDLMFTFLVQNFTDCLSIIITQTRHQTKWHQSNNTSGEHKDFKNSNIPEILKYTFPNGDHVKMWADLNSRNWDQILWEVQNIENTKESFTKVLIDTAKKIALKRKNYAALWQVKLWIDSIESTVRKTINSNFR